MADESGPPETTESIDVDSALQWDRSDPGERELLLEEDTIYAEDLVHLGLGWQDFGNLVVRKRS